MKLSNKMLLALFTVLTLGFYLSGCVNLDQKTVLKDDGSGTMKVKYWTKSSNVTSDELAGFGFTEAKAKANYSSSNTEVSDIVVKKNATTDSTTEVSLNVKFKDFNKLSDAKAFSKIKASYVKGKDGMDFKYVLLEDTANSKQMGMNEYKLTYEFDFPGEVINTNGKKDGKVVKWENTVADLKDDIEYTATIKSGGKCGLFGLELPIIILFGISVLYTAKRRKK